MRAQRPHLLYLFAMHREQKRINARRIPRRELPWTCANSSLLLRLSHSHAPERPCGTAGPFSGLFVAFPIPRAALRCVVAAVAVRLCAPVVPNADRTPSGLRKRLFINDPSSWGANSESPQANRTQGGIALLGVAVASQKLSCRNLLTKRVPPCSSDSLLAFARVLNPTPN